MKTATKVSIPMVVILAVILGLGPRLALQEDEAVPSIGPPTASALQVFSQRVEAEPRDAVSATILGDLYLQRARETGDLTDLERARAAFTLALDTLPDRTRALTGLAQTHLALHDFEQALDLADDIEARSPGRALAIRGDALVALGRYEEARDAYFELAEVAPSPLLTARLAHLDFLSGDLSSARADMRDAAETVTQAGLTGEPVAWFWVRVGDLEFAAGAYQDAEAAYRRSLELFGSYHLAYAGIGRALAAQGDLEAAIEAYEQAIRIQPLPETLSAVGDLYLISDRRELAADRLATLEVVAQLGEGVYDRAIALHLADHGEAQQAVDIARAEYERRADVYTADTLAWALYRAGEIPEASTLAERAVALGTADAVLWYHAGAIRLAAGETNAGVAALEHALALSPEFDPVAAAHARELLEAG